MEAQEPYETTVAVDMIRLLLLHLEQEMVSNNLDQEIQRKLDALGRDGKLQSYLTSVVQPEMERAGQLWFDERGIDPNSREGQALVLGVQQRSITAHTVREHQAQQDFLRQLTAALNEAGVDATRVHDEVVAPFVPAGTPQNPRTRPGFPPASEFETIKSAEEAAAVASELAREASGSRYIPAPGVGN